MSGGMDVLSIVRMSYIATGCLNPHKAGSWSVADAKEQAVAVELRIEYPMLRKVSS